MATGSRIPPWARRHSDLIDIGAGVAAGFAVLGLALLQWGMTDAGWTRGVTLGATLGVVVALAVRRDRLRSAARERAEAEERLQLARELHDAVASQVSIIGIQAAAARRLLGSQPRQADGALGAIETAARSANADLRRMLATLRLGGQTTSAPGLGDLDALADEYRALGLKVELDASNAARSVPAPLDTVAYRIVQEALANVLAHAGHVHTSVQASVDGDVLRLIVANEAGRPASVHRGSGLGLRGIRERAQLNRGTVEAGRRPDGGSWSRRRCRSRAHDPDQRVPGG
jgi:signal transduction histidine kinase